MSRFFRAALTIAILLYAALLIRYTCYAAGGADSSGYLNAARMIAHLQTSVRVAPLDVMGLDSSWRSVFIPLGFGDAPALREMVPTYPFGYPLHLFLLGVTFGWKRAPFLVTPIMAILSLVMTYRVARLFGLDRRWSAATSALLAIAPSFLFMALQPMSDVTATFWCTASILFALRATKRPQYAALCGAAFAIAVWVRPSNLLLGAAVAVAILFGGGTSQDASAATQERKMRWRSLAIAVVAALPFAVALMALDRGLYGSAVRTGYGSFAELVRLSYVTERLPHYAKWLAILETPLVFPGALLVAADRNVVRGRRALLFTWFAAFFGFYIFYVAYDAWWYTRFLLPAFPPLLIAFMLVLRDASARWRWPAFVAAVLMAIVAIQAIRFDRREGILHMRESEAVYPYASRWAEKKLPPNALPVSMQLSGSIYYYDHRFPIRYDALTPDKFQELRAYAANAGLPWYAVVFDWEVPELQKNLPGNWTQVDSNRNVLLMRLVDR